MTKNCIICGTKITQKHGDRCYNCYVETTLILSKVEKTFQSIEEIKREFTIAKRELEKELSIQDKCYIYAIGLLAQEKFNFEYPLDYIRAVLSESAPSSTNEVKTIPCLLCKKPGLQHLCFECYQKCQGQNIYIKFTNGKAVPDSAISEDKLKKDNSRREGLRYKCDDGHWVRSEAEREIDNFLYRHNIRHAYETAMATGGRPIHPDFWLPDYNVYIEHHGINGDPTYDARNKYKEQFFRSKRVIISTKEDLEDINSFFMEKLNIKQTR